MIGLSIDSTHSTISERLGNSNHSTPSEDKSAENDLGKMREYIARKVLVTVSVIVNTYGGDNHHQCINQAHTQEQWYDTHNEHDQLATRC